MAEMERCEHFEHAIIDCSDMTLTEYGKHGVRVYSLREILERWNGVVDVELTIRRRTELPPQEEG